MGVVVFPSLPLSNTYNIHNTALLPGFNLPLKFAWLPSSVLSFVKGSGPSILESAMLYVYHYFIVSSSTSRTNASTSASISNISLSYWILLVVKTCAAASPTHKNRFTSTFSLRGIYSLSHSGNFCAFRWRRCSNNLNDTFVYWRERYFLLLENGWHADV